MAISVFDMFSIGIGPSSSHTVGPMRAARQFCEELATRGELEKTASIRVELFGSLGATGRGHGSDQAVVLGLMGEAPETVDVDRIPERMAAVESTGRLAVLGHHEVAFALKEQLLLHRRRTLPLHPNGMCFQAFDEAGKECWSKTYYSVGGGFVLEARDDGTLEIVEDDTKIPFPFASGEELLARCKESGSSISRLVFENEKVWRSEKEIEDQLDRIWEVMRASVKRGCEREGILPGGLRVKRRAAGLHRKLRTEHSKDPLRAMDWVNLIALAVSEENAAGGRVVTAPTNGAAGIIPAVLHYYLQFHDGAEQADIRRFLLCAAAIGIIYKTNASISGAEVGCQGEVGVACSMAAAGLAEIMGGSPAQVENAAEIGMEHNLGLTCDPVGALVQVPCIERNAMGAVKAINAARLALRGEGDQKVSLDKVIETMRQTGADMKTKYKETSRGGLAVNIIEC